MIADEAADASRRSIGAHDSPDGLPSVRVGEGVDACARLVVQSFDEARELDLALLLARERVAHLIDRSREGDHHVPRVVRLAGRSRWCRRDARPYQDLTHDVFE